MGKLNKAQLEAKQECDKLIAELENIKRYSRNATGGISIDTETGERVRMANKAECEREIANVKANRKEYGNDEIWERVVRLYEGALPYLD